MKPSQELQHFTSLKKNISAQGDLVVDFHVGEIDQQSTKQPKAKTISGIARMITDTHGDNYLEILDARGVTHRYSEYNLGYSGLVNKFKCDIIRKIPAKLATKAPWHKETVDHSSGSLAAHTTIVNEIQSRPPHNPFAHAYMYKWLRKNKLTQKYLTSNFNQGWKADGIPENLKHLLVDPAIMTRIEDFREFVIHNKDLKKKDVIEVRRAYEQDLIAREGYKEKYRALWLTTEQANSIQKNGLLAAGLAGAKPRIAIRNYFDNGPWSGARKQIAQRLRGGETYDTKIGIDVALSYTASAEFALSVANQAVGKQRGKELYVVKARLSPLDEISRNSKEVYSKRPVNAGAKKYINWDTELIPVNDDKIETFAFFGTSPEKIVKVYAHEGDPPPRLDQLNK